MVIVNLDPGPPPATAPDVLPTSGTDRTRALEQQIAALERRIAGALAILNRADSRLTQRPHQAGSEHVAVLAGQLRLALQTSRDEPAPPTPEAVYLAAAEAEAVARGEFGPGHRLFGPLIAARAQVPWFRAVVDAARAETLREVGSR